MRRSPDAALRVLLLDDHPPGVPPEVDVLLGARFEHAGVVVDLDAVRSPGSALRVITTHADALDRYDALIAVTAAPSRQGAVPTALHAAAAGLASRLPTLLVHVQPSAAGRGLRPAPTAAGIDALVLAAGTAPTTAARRIATTLLGLLEHPDRLLHEHDQTASTPGSGSVAARLDHIARLARDAFHLDAAEVNLIDLDRVTTIAAAGRSRGSRPRDGSLCALALARPGVTVISDTWLDHDACRIDTSRGDDPIRFYAAAPLRNEDGDVIGTLCVYDSLPQQHGHLDLTLLDDLALLAEGELIHGA